MTNRCLYAFNVATMYVDSSTIHRNGKSYTRHLLRISFRENGKVKHKTIANISKCSDDEVNAIKLALKHKKNLHLLNSTSQLKVKAVLGKRIGAVWVLRTIAQRIGLVKALGNQRNGKLALLQILVRVIDQGSRLSAVRFATKHAICEIIGIDKLDEDDLYSNLDWLHQHQEKIEKALFKLRYPNQVPTLFLYDVTSSYLEGTCNELANWGYNRDKKRGKMQIVVGLLTGPDGLPVACRVFMGNTSDTKTVAEQVRILARIFKVKKITLVGDRGMLKGPQIEQLPDDFRFITAITKPQILKMLEDQVIQYDLFSEKVCEVQKDGVRYILRRNPIRAEQLASNREQKHQKVQEFVQDRNKYLTEHKRASTDVALRKVRAKIKSLKCDAWLKAASKQRFISIGQDETELSKASLLDGCYVIKSDVSGKDAETKTLHDRYCDLENVERAFRTMKSAHLEIRPVYVRKDGRTRGHVFVVMLALLLQRELESCWKDLNLTVEEGIEELAAIHLQDLHVGSACIQNIPEPSAIGKQLINRARVMLPQALPNRKANVHTKKELPSERNIN